MSFAQYAVSTGIPPADAGDFAAVTRWTMGAQTRADRGRWPHVVVRVAATQRLQVEYLAALARGSIGQVRSLVPLDTERSAVDRAYVRAQWERCRRDEDASACRGGIVNDTGIEGPIRTGLSRAQR
jgi:hypothetical protein